MLLTQFFISTCAQQLLFVVLGTQCKDDSKDNDKSQKRKSLLESRSRAKTTKNEFSFEKFTKDMKNNFQKRRELAERLNILNNILLDKYENNRRTQFVVRQWIKEQGALPHYNAQNSEQRILKFNANSVKNLNAQNLAQQAAKLLTCAGNVPSKKLSDGKPSRKEIILKKILNSKLMDESDLEFIELWLRKSREEARQEINSHYFDKIPNTDTQTLLADMTNEDFHRVKLFLKTFDGNLKEICDRITESMNKIFIRKPKDRELYEQSLSFDAEPYEKPTETLYFCRTENIANIRRRTLHEIGKCVEKWTAEMVYYRIAVVKFEGSIDGPDPINVQYVMALEDYKKAPPAPYVLASFTASYVKPKENNQSYEFVIKQGLLLENGVKSSSS